MSSARLPPHFRPGGTDYYRLASIGGGSGELVEGSQTEAEVRSAPLRAAPSQAEQLYLSNDDRPEARRSREFWRLHSLIVVAYRRLTGAR